MSDHREGNVAVAGTGMPVTRAWKGDIRVAAGLGLAAGLATAALFPYLLQLMPQKFARLPVPLPLLIAAQTIQAMVVLGLLSLAGLRMGHRVGLGAPWLQSVLNRDRSLSPQRMQPWRSALLGLGAALLVLALARLFEPWLPAMINPPARAGTGAQALHGFLASFYGGIAEELQLRLFLMTLLVWIVARLRKAPPGNATYWAAILAAAVLFGAGHLPAASQIWGWDVWVVIRTLALNAVVGVACGWLYWKQGLEMAILAHFCADIVLHVLVPLLAVPLP